MARNCAALPVLRLRLVIALVVPCNVLHPNIFRDELLRGKLVEEVFGSDEASLFVGVLEQDLVETLDDGLHYLLKAEAHRLLFFAVGSDVLPKLLVNLLYDSVQPVAHVRVNQLHFFGHFGCLVVEFLSRLDFDVQLVDFGVR